jgi:hypothetical protein
MPPRYGPTPEQELYERKIKAGVLTKQIELRAEKEIVFNEEEFKAELRKKLNELSLDELKNTVGHKSTSRTLSGFTKGISRTFGRTNNNSKSELKPLIEKYIDSQVDMKRYSLFADKKEEIINTLSKEEKKQLDDERHLSEEYITRIWNSSEQTFKFHDSSPPDFPTDADGMGFIQPGYGGRRRKTRSKKAKSRRRR